MATWRPEPRAGVSAQRIVLRGQVPRDGVEYFAAAAGDSPHPAGTKLAPGLPLTVPTPAWFHPQLHPEPAALLDLPVPVVFESADVLVVDKPHGLPSTPNGSLMRANTQTLLRVRRDEPDIIAAHRLDRLTGGLLLLSRRPATRGFLQTQFLRRQVRKVYHAQSAVCLDSVCGQPLTPGGQVTVRLGMLKIRDVPQVQVDPDGKETVTIIRRPAAPSPHPLFTYELEPLTGHTHQLRVLMNHLGAPLVGDDTYPIYAPSAPEDLSVRLGLRAVQLEFRDPQVGPVQLRLPD